MANDMIIEAKAQAFLKTSGNNTAISGNWTLLR